MFPLLKPNSSFFVQLFSTFLLLVLLPLGTFSNSQVHCLDVSRMCLEDLAWAPYTRSGVHLPLCRAPSGPGIPHFVGRKEAGSPWTSPFLPGPEFPLKNTGMVVEVKVAVGAGAGQLSSKAAPALRPLMGVSSWSHGQSFSFCPGLGDQPGEGTQFGRI